MSKKKSKDYNKEKNIENYIVCKSNIFAYEAIKNTCETDGINNFLIIYGDTGVGKTHLSHVADYIFKEQKKNVVHVSAEEFLNDFVTHISHQTMATFRKKYRKCDVLLIDDIQFINHKEGMQEELFYIESSHQKSPTTPINTTNKDYL